LSKKDGDRRKAGFEREEEDVYRQILFTCGAYSLLSVDL